jgi:hypothetical protein
MDLSNHTLSKMKYFETCNICRQDLKKLPFLHPYTKKLYCQKNLLTQLTDLPTGLTHLRFNDNLIQKLDYLPNHLKELCIFNNPITQFPPLPYSLRWIWISPWQIGSCLNNLKSKQITVVIVNK